MKIKQIQNTLETFLDEKVSELDANIKIISIVALILIPLITFYFSVYSPKNKQLSQLKQKKITLLETIRKVERNAKDIGKRRAEMQEAQLMFQKASNLLPQKQEIPTLLEGISDLGRNAGLNIVSFKPGQENTLEFYAEIPVSIELSGPYHNIGVFLDQISKMSRIVTVASLAISNPQKIEGEMILQSSIQLKTFRFVDSSDKPKKNSKKKK
jgi:type IV pilus assembly protein PilO